MKIIAFCCLLLACNAVQQPTTEQSTTNSGATTTVVADTIVPATYDTNGKLVKISKTDAEWKKELNAKEYNVLREEGTEYAFSGDLWKNHAAGTYVCRGCHLPLFSSDTKFDSGTGWPSFWQPIKPEYLADTNDESHGMNRTEVECARCGGHQGHVFDDGPKPTGLRYCINSVSLDFVPN